MKAPEKIYLEATYPDNGVLPNGLNYSPSPNDIEYIRKDVFIKEVSRYLKEHITNNPEASQLISRRGCITVGMLIEDLKKNI